MISCQFNLFWGYENGFVNIFIVLYDFNNTIDFITILNFTYSFVSVRVDISYDSNHHFSDLINKSKAGRNGCNKNAVSIFLFLTSPLFHLLIKQKFDVRVKIIHLGTFFFIGCPANIFILPCLTMRLVFAANHSFLSLNWSINLNPCMFFICTLNHFFCQIQS